MEVKLENKIRSRGENMENKKLKNENWRPFKSKLFFRTVMLMLVSAFACFFLYLFFLHGRFANWMVSLFQTVLQGDYDSALYLYNRLIRNHMELIIMISVLLIFLCVFLIYLNWFVRYFAEINRGMDHLIQENAADVSLSAELLPVERKLNTIKHTIEKQKAEILEEEQQKNDLIMYLAHDLKTPLASVIGYLNLLHDEELVTEELRQKYLAIALGKAERLEDLINEFFEISRFNLTHITLQYSRINLTRLLEQLVYEFKPMLDEKNLTCTLDMEDNKMLRCDADKIQRVFDNLLRNAVLYSFRDTEIRINVICRADSYIICFINHGDTIPREKLDRIFEQFYRLDVSRGTQNGGAGLGLAIAKQIVELHNGTLTANSENEQIAFTVTLPAIQDNGIPG